MRHLGVLLSPTGYVNVGDPTAYPIGVYNQNTREIATLAVMGVLTPAQATAINAGQAKLEDFNVTLPQMSAAIDLMNASGSLITSATDPASIATAQAAVHQAQAQPNYTPVFVQPTTPAPIVQMSTAPTAPATSAPVSAVPLTSGTIVPVAATPVATSWFDEYSFLGWLPNWGVLVGVGAIGLLLFSGKKGR